MDPPALSPCDALVAIMVTVSASDGMMGTPGLVAIERMVNHAPVFASYDADRIRPVAQTVITLLEEEEGLDALFGLVHETLPRRLHETAYALACDVVAADGRMGEVEAALMAEIRDQFEISRLHAAAIELAASVRHRML